MLKVLRDCIIGAYDEAMDSYLGSDEYKHQVYEANKLFFTFRDSLPSDQRKELDSVLRAFDEIATAEAEEAYFRGVVNGTQLVNGVIKGAQNEQQYNNL